VVFRSGHIYFEHGIKTGPPTLDAVCFLNIRSTVKCLLLLLYQIATFAPASAKPWVTAKPISAPAPETTAVLPLREKGGRTRLFLGAIVCSSYM